MTDAQKYRILSAFKTGIAAFLSPTHQGQDAFIDERLISGFEILNTRYTAYTAPLIVKVNLGFGLSFFSKIVTSLWQFRDCISLLYRICCPIKRTVSMLRRFQLEADGALVF